MAPKIETLAKHYLTTHGKAAAAESDLVAALAATDGKITTVNVAHLLTAASLVITAKAVTDGKPDPTVGVDIERSAKTVGAYVRAYRHGLAAIDATGATDYEADSLAEALHQNYRRLQGTYRGGTKLAGFIATLPESERAGALHALLTGTPASTGETGQAWMDYVGEPRKRAARPNDGTKTETGKTETGKTETGKSADPRTGTTGTAPAGAVKVNVPTSDEGVRAMARDLLLIMADETATAALGNYVRGAADQTDIDRLIATLVGVDAADIAAA